MCDARCFIIVDAIGPTYYQFILMPIGNNRFSAIQKVFFTLSPVIPHFISCYSTLYLLLFHTLRQDFRCICPIYVGNP